MAFLDALPRCLLARRADGLVDCSCAANATDLLQAFVFCQSGHDTRFGGSPLLIDDAHHLGLFSRLQQALAAHAKRDNAVYPLWQTAAIRILGRVLGLERLAAFALGEEDPLLRVTWGLRKLPDTPLLYRDLERMAAPAPRAALEPVQDLDTTVETVYGHQAGTAVGYHPTKHGRARYPPWVAFDGRPCEQNSGAATRWRPPP